MINLESRIKAKLTEQGMTIQRLSVESGVSEPTIHAIFNRGDAKLSQLEKIALALRTPLNFLLLDEFQASIIQSGEFNQAGTSNTQEIKVTHGSPEKLTSELLASQRALEVTRELLASQTQVITLLREQLTAKSDLNSAKDALIAAKDETIMLLRGTYTRPN